MYWECGTETVCECGQLDGMNSVFAPFGLVTRYHLSDNNPIRYWWNAVREFSRCKLTSPTDRLPAFSGFAAKIQCSELGEYHAGLWTGELPWSLLWRSVESIDDKAQALKTYIAPTWSWVSMSGPVEGPERFPWKNVIAKVKRIRSYPKTQNTLGEISAAWIRLEGPVRQGILEWEHSELPSGPSRGELSSMKNIPIAIYLDRLVNEDPDATVLSPLRDVLLMMVLLYSDPSHGYREGLLLVKSQKQQGAFERIGVFTIHTKKLGAIGKGWKHRAITII
jgi:hypothetical protein